MTRTNRIAIIGALVLFVIAAGTVLATRAPQAPQQPAGNQQDGEDEAPPDAAAVTHALDRLAANEIAVDEAVFTDLAARYGIGGAVRVSAWASKTGMSVEEITAKRDTGGENGETLGWGRLARELGVHPGVGSIMGNGRGPGEEPPGQARKDD